MSLVHKKKSIVFGQTNKSPFKLKIEDIINKHKNKINIDQRSTSRTKPKLVQKLSLLQAKNLQNLHYKTARSRRRSLNALIKDYDRNCIQNVQQKFQTIDQVKMQMFRTGVHYRSFQRSAGTGVRKLDIQSLKQYKDWNPKQYQNKDINIIKRAYSNYQKPSRCLKSYNKRTINI